MRKALFIVLPFIVAVFLFIALIFFISNNKDKGALQVTSLPSAKVYLNNKLLGATPLCECDLKTMLPSGDYSIKLVPVEGNFEPFEQKITISPKVLTVVDRSFGETGLSSGSIISLVPIDNPRDSQISVITFPDATQVFLDNSLQGQSPILLKNVTESDHEIKLTRDGYKDKIVRIRTVLGYKLEALVFLGINPQAASSSAITISSSSAQFITKVLILQTPTGFLRVRQDASVNSSEVGQVSPGEIYPLLNEQTGWYQIQLNNGNNGWISSQYAQKQAD